MFRSFGRFAPLTSLLLIAILVLTACSPSPAAAPTTAPSTSGGAAAPTAASAGAAPTAAPITGPAAATAPAAAGQATTAAPSGGPAPVAKNPGTFVYAQYGDPESLDPAWAYDTASGQVIFNVYETLLFPKRESATEFVPMLATKWDISQDGMTYTFDIRKGVKFQQGQDLTPEDVAYSLWRGMIQDRAGGPQWIMLQPFFGLSVQSFADDVVKGQFNGDWTKAAQAVEQAVTFDNTAGTVTMHLKQPYGPMLQILAGSWAAVVSKPWVIQQGGWDGTPATAEKFHDPTADADPLFKVMNGTGPFKLDRWAPNEEVDLSRNDNYWLQAPLWDGGPSGPAKLDKAIIKNVSEWGTRFAMFQAGDADSVLVDQQYISQVQPLVKEECAYQTGGSFNCTQAGGNGSVRVFTGLPTLIVNPIQFNENVNTTGGNSGLGSGVLDGNGIPANFFGDINVRKGFSYAFDYDTYIKQVYNGEAIQALGPIIEGELGYDPNQAHYTFDLQKATDAFKASTLKSADGKSLWDTGFYVQYVYNTGNDQRRVAGEILKQELAKINPKFKISVVDEPWPVFLKDQVSARMALYLLGWAEDFHDPHDWVQPFMASGGTYAGTQSFPKDLQTQLDKLINEGVSTTDQQARAKIYAQLQNLSYENALDMWLVQPETRFYEHTWVNGWYYNPVYQNNVYFYPLSK